VNLKPKEKLLSDFHNSASTFSNRKYLSNKSRTFYSLLHNKKLHYHLRLIYKFCFKISRPADFIFPSNVNDLNLVSRYRLNAFEESTVYTLHSFVSIVSLSSA
jgi:hypothetical protein